MWCQSIDTVCPAFMLSLNTESLLLTRWQQGGKRPEFFTPVKCFRRGAAASQQHLPQSHPSLPLSLHAPDYRSTSNTFWNGGKVSGYQECQRFLLSFCFLSSVTTWENRSFWPSFLELDILHHPLGWSLFWLENKQEHTLEISGILICDFVYISPSEVDENTRIKLQSKTSSQVHNKASKLLISPSSAETLETLISLSQIGCWHTFRVDCSWGCAGSSVAAILWGLHR